MGRTFTWNFKRNVVNYAELNGVKAAARQFHVDAKSIRDWRLIKYPIQESTQSLKTNEYVRRAYTLDFKLNVVKYAKENSVEAAARQYKLHPRSIREWSSRQQCMKKASNTNRFKVLNQVTQNSKRIGKKRSICVNKKCIYREVKNILASRITGKFKNTLISKEMIEFKILELLKTEYKENFIFKLAWLHEFLKKRKLNLKNNFTTDIGGTNFNENIHYLKNMVENSTRSPSDLNLMLKDLKSVKASKQNLFEVDTEFKNEHSSESVSFVNKNLKSCTSCKSITSGLSVKKNRQKKRSKRNENLVTMNAKGLSQNSTSIAIIKEQISSQNFTSVGLNEFFSKNSHVSKSDPVSKNKSTVVKESQTVNPISVQGLIACIAFNSYFKVKHI